MQQADGLRLIINFANGSPLPWEECSVSYLELKIPTIWLHLLSPALD